MSNFKKGDLVEVIGSDSRDLDVIGLRFTLEIYEEVYSMTLREHVYTWRTPLKGFSARECYLRKVNPDGDNLSEFTFDELMDDLKYTKQKEKANEYE